MRAQVQAGGLGGLRGQLELVGAVALPSRELGTVQVCAVRDHAL
jgi:hypothetical protein